MLKVDRQLTWRGQVYVIPAELAQMLAIALLLALIYWVVALFVRADGQLLVWDDYRSTFSSAFTYLRSPYEESGFFNAPWTMVLLLPFDPLPLELGAFIMITSYFVLLALVVRKFGGGKGALLVALTSVLAFDTALEINIDWLVCIGLLVPPMWSIPFLLVKPQTAFGYVLSFSRKEWVRAGIVFLLTLLISFALWGDWPLDFMGKYRLNTRVNLAPSSILSLPVSLLIGGILVVVALRKRDPIVGILAGLFFVPYIAPNSVLLSFTLVAVRWFRFALLLNVVTWLIVIRILMG